MALIEAVLTYRPTVGSEQPIPIGSTADRKALRVIRDRLLEAARDEAAFWGRIDPGVAAMKAAEADRLERVLGILLPDDDEG
jgi:hypothetical protein